MTTLIAIFEQKTSGDKMHYVYTDYLGSLRCITSDNGTIEQRLSYDAWGGRRDYLTGLKLTDAQVAEATMLTSHGYTGQEHIDGLGLINLNARFYEPAMGIFLSPDNYVQAPDNSQNLNRYTYCLNNPLMYTDKDGDFFVLLYPVLYGMAMGATTYTIQHLATNHSFNNWNWGNFIGATVAGGVGGAIAPSLASKGIGGFKGGLITGAASGFSYYLTSSIINKQKSILSNSIKGLVVGGLIGGGIGAIDASLKGQRLWDGRGKTLARRYITSSGETPEIGDYTKDRLYKMNTVSRMQKKYPLKYGPVPLENENYIKRHFEGDLTVEGYAYPGEESFDVKVDGNNLISTTTSGKISATISSNSHSISWGFTGDYYEQVVTEQVGNQLSEVVSRPNSSILIYENWRSWNGFLFW